MEIKNITYLGLLKEYNTTQRSETPGTLLLIDVHTHIVGHG